MGDLFITEEDLYSNLDLSGSSPFDLIYDLRLSNDRIFYIDFEIDTSIYRIQKQIININLEDFKKGIPANKRKPIKLLIDCVGGNLDETMSLVATIKQSVTPVWTINIANAFSGGALILLSGSKRFALPYSKAMIHTGYNEITGTYEQIIEQVNKYKKEIIEMKGFILSNTTISGKLYNKMKSKDWYMTCKEQVYYGLVDEIVENLYSLLEE